jgi:hypothetical protein
MADPGTGVFRFNNATVASVTAIAFDATSADTGNPDVSDFIAAWDDVSNAVGSVITLKKAGTPATFAAFYVTAVTDNTGWLEATVTHIASNGSWSASDTAYIQFNQSGADGSGSLSNVVEDTTPQLGGMLDMNGNALGDGTLELLTFTETASAVNHVNVTNAATGNGPSLAPAGDDDNVDLNLAAKGTGLIKLNDMVKLTKGADIASATALTLGTDGNQFDVTGTTTITSIGTVSVGTEVTLQFDDALTLTHHATDLILPGGANITTAAGDIAVFYEYAAGDWRCVSYQVAASAPGAGGGKILQVVQTWDTSQNAGLSSTSYADIGIGATSITPASASNKVLCLFSMTIGTSHAGVWPTFQLYRQINGGGYSALAGSMFAHRTDTVVHQPAITYYFLDSPASVLQVDYKVYYKVNSGSIYLPYLMSGSSGDEGGGLTLLEVGA